MVKPCKPRQLVPTLIADGYLSGANQCPSPNVNARPKDDDISLLVIHNISLSDNYSASLSLTGPSFKKKDYKEWKLYSGTHLPFT